ncbi:hypothetical protein AB7C87_06635 [Natrarchaeobius sp. A-rgal3]|uniref:hypothetical protein n=1 Tax=Natrarchaeobius versutus TaxID=1679078 RepID=UPI00350FA94B
MIQQLDDHISNYEGSIAVLLSALLVLLYNKQQRIQNSQKDILEKQADFQETQHQPVLVFEDIFISEDNFEALIKNIGNGPALNMHLFMGSGEPDQDPQRSRNYTKFSNGHGLNTILPSSEADLYSVEIKYETFPHDSHVNNRVKSIAENYQLSATRIESRPAVYLTYDDLSGETHYVELLKTIENISGETYEEYFEKSDIHDLTTNRKDVSISEIALDEFGT